MNLDKPKRGAPHFFVHRHLLISESTLIEVVKKRKNSSLRIEPRTFRVGAKGNVHRAMLTRRLNSR